MLNLGWKNSRSLARFVKSSVVIDSLESRKLVQVVGSSAGEYLQGLVTNDVNHLQLDQPHHTAIYAMFLNSKARLLYDTIIYKRNSPDHLYIECDKNVVPDLISLLKKYKVRRKLSIDICDELDLHTVNSRNTEEMASLVGHINERTDAGVVVDPRTPALGLRLTCPSGTNIVSKLEETGLGVEQQKTSWYRALRYRLGVAEGSDELPPGQLFSLEANCDYLHGVSFHKGCYIGQELTARTHHTGAVRKRLMPLLLSEDVSPAVAPDTPVMAEEKPVGKLRAHEGNCAVGLLRVEEVLRAPSLMVAGKACRSERPSWWPAQAPKQASGH